MISTPEYDTDTIQRSVTSVAVSASPVESDAGGATYPRRQILLTLGGLLLALLFASLDGFIVGTAMPRIVGDLHGFDRYTWVTTGYMLTATVLIPIYGKLSDLIGRKTIIMGCLTIFLIGSALSGLAQSMNQLILFRAAQGLGAGGIMPVSMAAFADLLTPKQRAKWQGVFLSTTMLSSIVGPVLGGWITDHASWHWIFYINLPFGLLALATLAVVMPPLRHSSAWPRIDVLGAALLIVGFTPTLLGLSWAGSIYPWGSWQTLAPIGGGLIAVALFILHERRLERRGGEPIVAPSLFANRAYSVSLLCIMIAFMGMAGSLAFLPLYAQGVLRVSATDSGFVLTPMLLSLMASMMLTGMIAARTGASRAIAVGGMVVLLVGGALLVRLDLHSGYVDMVAAIVVIGLGLGAGFGIYSSIVMNALPPWKRGQGMASFDFFQEMGGPLALAVLGPVLAARYAPNYHAALATTIKGAAPTALTHAFDKPDILLEPTSLHALTAHYVGGARSMLDGVLDAVRIGLASSVHTVFLFSLVIISVGVVASLFLPRVDLREQNAETPAGDTGVEAPSVEARPA